jgi:hypothetical protein
LKSQNKSQEINYSHGNIRISISQAEVQDSCYASIKLYNNYDSLVNVIEYKSIEALGGYSGLFVDNNPVIGDNFIITKKGDYDGRTILVKKDGKIEDLPGGAYFISEDKRLLFSEHLQDCCDEFIVYDLKKGKIIFTSDFESDGIEHDIIRFYRRGKSIYVLTFNEDLLNGIYKYDCNKNILEKVKKTELDMSALTEIKLLPDLLNIKVCGCKN